MTGQPLSAADLTVDELVDLVIERLDERARQHIDNGLHALLVHARAGTGPFADYEQSFDNLVRAGLLRRKNTDERG